MWLNSIVTVVDASIWYWRLTEDTRDILQVWSTIPVTSSRPDSPRQCAWGIGGRSNRATMLWCHVVQHFLRKQARCPGGGVAKNHGRHANGIAAAAA